MQKMYVPTYYVRESLYTFFLYPSRLKLLKTDLKLRVEGSTSKEVTSFHLISYNALATAQQLTQIAPGNIIPPMNF